MAATLAEGGYLLTDRPEEAAVILINTCAFILPAKEESIEEILRMAAWKQRGKRALHPPGRDRLSPPALREGTGGGAAGGRSLPRHQRGSPHRPPSRRASVSSGRAGCRRRSVIGRPTFLMNAGHRRLGLRSCRPAPTSRSPTAAPTAVPTASSPPSAERPGAGRSTISSGKRRTSPPGGPRTDRHRPGHDGLRPRPEGETDAEPPPHASSPPSTASPGSASSTPTPPA